MKSDYERIAAMIRHLDQYQPEQPSLRTLAEVSGLSESHLHRLFVKWSGITPKDFLQCLTLTRIKQALRNGSSVLDASLIAGLSGPGRAHDLCVTLEAASPGEIKSGGAGWTIRAGFADSPFGTCLIAESPRGICHLCFVSEAESPSEVARLRNAWRNATFVFDDAWAGRKSVEIFDDPRQQTSHCLLVRGTPFQVRVWRALVAIPPGRLLSYGKLAAALGIPTAARAVGSAVGSNEISYLIPCHRVIRETGIIGEYRWSRERKQMMIARELVRQ